MSKVLYLTYDGLTDPLGQSQILPYIVGLSQNGFQFTIISFEKESRYDLTQKIQDICEKNKIEWIRCTFTSRPKYISKLYDLIRFQNITKNVLKRGNYKIIHCRSYQSIFIANRLKSKFNISTLFDMRGFWVDERVEGGIWNMNNLLFRIIYRYFKRIEKRLLIESDHIISLTHKAADTITNDIIPGVDKKISIIPCCADMNLFDSSTISTSLKIKKREALGIVADQFVLGYLGAIGSWYLLPEMIDFFEQLLKEKPNAIFLFVSQEPKDRIIQIFRNKNISLDHLKVERAERNEVPLYVSLFDWLIFFTKPSFSHLARSPVKQGEAMSLGIPVICNSGIGDSAELIKKYDSGLVLDSLDQVSYKAAAKIISNKNVEHSKIEAGAKDYFQLDDGITKYVKVYEEF